MSLMQDIAAWLGRDLERVKERIVSSLSSDIGLLDSTNKNILAHSGKMMRPVLALLVARTCSGGQVKEDTIRFACATELLHNATLLHDDVVDGSTERRGQPTTNAVLGSAASVLVGDFWLVKAVDNVLEADNSATEVIRLFSKTLSDLAEGEMLQLQRAFDGMTTEDDYYRIIYNKTTSLFETAAVSAAVSVGASEGETVAVRKFTENLGQAFQIKDDILDYEGGALIGKPVYQDLRERKITLPLLGALAAAPQEEAADMRNLVKTGLEDENALGTVLDFVGRYGGLDYARKCLEEKVESAVSALEALPECEDRKLLASLARFVAERKA